MRICLISDTLVKFRHITQGYSQDPPYSIMSMWIVSKVFTEAGHHQKGLYAPIPNTLVFFKVLMSPETMINPPPWSRSSQGWLGKQNRLSLRDLVQGEDSILGLHLFHDPLPHFLTGSHSGHLNAIFTLCCYSDRGGLLNPLPSHLRLYCSEKNNMGKCAHRTLLSWHAWNAC